MSDMTELTTEQLFRRWRQGDGHAGQAMAQRFSDWYYAITSSRLGDRDGRKPLVTACERFQQGITRVTDTDTLGEWAHGLLKEEVLAAGGRLPGGDFANALTRQRRPSELLAMAAQALPRAQVDLLVHAYDARTPIDAVEREAEAAGGYPLAVLEARYALKRWLRDHEQVAFTEVPATPNLDRAPLPLYEAGRMQAAEDDYSFEKWILTDMSLCKDVAEFAAFALALRGGLVQPASPAGVRSTPTARAAPAARHAAPATADQAVEAPATTRMPLVAIGLAVAVVAAVVLLMVFRA